MRVSKIILAISGVLLLGACANGSPQWMRGDSSYPSWWRGYGSDLQGPVLKPQGPQGKQSDDLSAKFWRRTDGYGRSPVVTTDTQQQMQSPGAKTSTGNAVEYRDVTVYPVDGDAQPYDDMKFDFTNKVAHMPDAGAPAPAAQASAQAFFGLGKSVVGAHDRGALRQLVIDLQHAGGKYTLRVVGYASRDAQDTPARVRANDALAQKRADAVAQVLTGAGVKASKIKTFSRGDSGDERRVDVFVDSGE